MMAISDFIRQAKLSRLLLISAALISWLGLWHLAKFMEYAPHASLWYPPSALSFALFLVFGHRAFGLVFAAGFLNTLLVDFSYYHDLGTYWPLLLLAAGYGLMQGVVYGLAAALVRWFCQGGWNPRRLSDAAVFLFAVIAASSGAAWLGAHNLYWVGKLPYEIAQQIVLPWWFGDMVGVVTLGPVFAYLLTVVAERLSNGMTVSLGLRYQHGGASGGGRFWLKWLLLVLTATGAEIYALRAAEPIVDAGRFYLMLVPLIWIALTETVLRSLISVASLALVLAILARVQGIAGHGELYQGALMLMVALTYAAFSLSRLFEAGDAIQRRGSATSPQFGDNRSLLLAWLDTHYASSAEQPAPARMLVYHWQIKGQSEAEIADAQAGFREALGRHCQRIGDRVHLLDLDSNTLAALMFGEVAKSCWAESVLAAVGAELEQRPLSLQHCRVRLIDQDLGAGKGSAQELAALERAWRQADSRPLTAFRAHQGAN